ncbi:four-carbon acid sugar kinase family protein [Halomonas sp. MCCC 1A17488]|uniref:3-oxo-tetronate kinase n=1 Tax=Billgrantia sulfidoxydans TaxID=2733484 RepID=A0ABX7W8V4_9GAMM|nr:MULTISPECIES: 3-oxo-tetronate kinase [Halomonas]MCE8017612.1 four-carbon acid sugar kinase family protein [Halomonas sp. MCCC 1A17488]MCG3240945.1 four-carbon acid sugar kinase family protein [Halomonas sp. MCCC 1A17488]QPP48815.1 four-carbon acid sugar kinase family protein [Halomonas sp. SS10-MC5]QTP56147.1 four-carbon acid sugar kinase family protein [Halomonas sulfidoxydans]
MAIVLGAIADDFTGATDLANNLVRGGMRCVQLIGVPEQGLGELVEGAGEIDAVVIALKSRSCPPAEAVRDSLRALEWLRAEGARQLYFKYCSTFDSTDEGNIGPVSEAVLERLEAPFTVMVPAFPANGRTVYQGHLFVGDRLLSESGMQHHPLTPMRDADLVRVLSRQSRYPVGLQPWSTLALGAPAVSRQLEELAGQGVRQVICDTLDHNDLAVLAEATVDLPLVCGGSGLGQALPAQYRRRGWLGEASAAGALAPASGSALVLSGSCSRATLAQVDAFLTRFPGFPLDPLMLAQGPEHRRQALAFARRHLAGGRPVLVYASAEAERVSRAQQALGRERAGELVEQALGELAVALVDEGVGRLVVAGGESSGAVVSALGVRALRIGEQIDPGVPWTQATLAGHEAPLSLALKSGNFGGEDFFLRAFEVLP